MKTDSYDVLIVGGGIMGCSTAYYLSTFEPGLKLAVIEKDPTYERASTALSMANIRVQFSLEANVRISMYAMEILERFDEDMAVAGEKPAASFRREGNLFLVEEPGRPAAEKALAMQQALGCAVEWWSPERIRSRYPLYNLEGSTGGTFGAGDGHIDAYAVLMGYKNKARSLGAVFLADEVVSIEKSSGKVQGVKTASGRTLAAPIVVNCTGAWAAKMAETAGVALPIEPVQRHVFVLDTKVKPDGPLPLTVLPSGLYFRTETGLILLGKSVPEDKVGFDFNWDRDRFQDRLWPELAEFVPAFDTLKLLRGWAGLYAVNRLDGNAILGEWPELKGFYLANGFSGHGLQQGPAVGRYMAELILGREPALDLSIFSPQRVLENRPLSENGLV
jgi:glycine/D-amino acid oxidase-like deaminating enzyme